MAEKVYIPIDEFLQECESKAELVEHIGSIKEAVSHVAESRNGSSALPPFPLEEPKNEFDRQWNKNCKYYYANEEELAKQYNGKCVAIVNQQVVAVNDTIRDLAEDVYSRYGNVPVYAGFPGNKKVEQLDLPFEFPQK